MNAQKLNIAAATLAAVALAGCALAACTKNPDMKPSPKAATPASKAAPSTAADPSGPAASKPEIGMPQGCNLGPCHGLDDLTCTAGPPMMCTEIYKHGDFCRQFVKCAAVDGNCALQADAKFAECKACMEACKSKLDCDTTCRDALGVP